MLSKVEVHVKEHIFVPESVDSLFLARLLWDLYAFLFWDPHWRSSPHLGHCILSWQRTGTQETEVNPSSALQAHFLLAKRSHWEAWPGVGNFLSPCRKRLLLILYKGERGMIENKDTVYYNLPQKTAVFLKEWFLKDTNRQSLINLIWLLHKNFFLCISFSINTYHLAFLSRFLCLHIFGVKEA